MKAAYHLPSLAALAAAACLMSTPSRAALVDFEAVQPGTLLLNGDSLVQGAARFTAIGSLVVIDGTAAFGAGQGLDLAPPLGNDSTYLISLNDTAVRLQAADGGVFRLQGLDFGFVSALSDLFQPGDLPGLLVAGYEAADGSVGLATWSFGLADAQGRFRFQRLDAGNLGLLDQGLRRVDFAACTVDAAGLCSVTNVNFSQFALDNIAVSAPPSLALALSALALSAVGTQRRRPAASPATC